MTLNLKMATVSDDAFAIPFGHLTLYLTKSPLPNHMVIEVFEHGQLSGITQIPLSDLTQIINSFET